MNHHLLLGLFHRAGNARVDYSTYIYIERDYLNQYINKCIHKSTNNKQTHTVGT